MHGEITADQARTLALKHVGAVADGKDPVEEARQERAKRDNQRTVSSVLDDHIEKYVKVKRLRSETEIVRVFEKYVKPRIGDMAIEDVRRSTIAHLIDEVVNEHGPIMADRVRAHLSKCFNWYETRTDEFVSPIVRGMAVTRSTERARTRTLNPEEIETLWRASNALSDRSGALVKMLLLTGQRIGEVGKMRWDEVSNAVWKIPADKYKTGREHVVPLTPATCELLDNLPMSGDYVFGRKGKTPYSGFSKLKKQLDREIASLWADDHDAPMPHWVFHDLRRTARSFMAAEGVPGEHAERVLGHVINGVEGVYNRHGYDLEKQAALEALAKSIDQISRSTFDNVITLGETAST